VLIVHSAISGITDRLECLLDAAIGQAQEDELRAIEECHRRLASELAIPLGAEVQRAPADLDRLECLLDAAIGQAQEDELRAIEECHRRLASELAIPLGAEVQRALAE